MNALHMQVVISLGGSFFQKDIFLGVLKKASAAFVGQGQVWQVRGSYFF